MSGYVVGELVDVTMRGVRVAAVVPVAGTTVLRLRMDEDEIDLALVTGITVTRVAPAEWPPQIGDVWDDAHGGSWWTRYNDGEPYLQSETGGVDEPTWVLERYGPMKLAYRRGWTPESAAIAAAAVEPAEPEVLDERAETIAGLRQLIDWLEAHPDAPIGATERRYSVFPRGETPEDKVGSLAELRRLGDALGLDPEVCSLAHVLRSGPRFRGGVQVEFIVCDAAHLVRAEARRRPAPVVTGDGAGSQTLLGAEEVAGPVGAGPATEPEAETLLAVEEVGGSGSGHGKAEPPTGPAAKPTSPLVVLVASPIPGGPPARAEVAEDKGGTTVKVIYCDSRTGARVARRRILGSAPDPAAYEGTCETCGKPFATSEARAGFKTCEHCPAPTVEPEG